MSTEEGRLGFAYVLKFKLHIWSSEVDPDRDARWTQDQVIDLTKLPPFSSQPSKISDDSDLVPYVIPFMSFYTPVCTIPYQEHSCMAQKLNGYAYLKIENLAISLASYGWMIEALITNGLYWRRIQCPCVKDMKLRVVSAKSSKSRWKHLVIIMDGLSEVFNGIICHFVSD
ncbi:hypothetical protein EJB05_53354, partial [Eragrostis curvula]